MKKHTDSIDKSITEARRAIEDGRVDKARDLLREIARRAPDDPRPWLLLAGLTTMPRERRAYLDQARRLDAATGRSTASSESAPIQAYHEPVRARCRRVCEWLAA